ncbi:peptidylprolyl isomerase [Paenibacillus chartarius]|uniref:Peptidylprolyl isomerase n=1 Tax=Paenibacillus chartarius TaxID=747481 RepID=A0ABV6DQ35_9BACL
MKDKTKGLLLGLAIGTMLSGSVAYAGGTQIEVAFRELKFMFDGIEKKPSETPAFIYQGTTYVPVRFVSEALGRNVEWDDAASTIWIGDKTSAAAVVAAYNGGVVTNGEFSVYLAVTKMLNSRYTGGELSDEQKKALLEQLIAERWFAAQATEEQKSAAAAKSKAQLLEWQERLGGEEALRNALTPHKLVLDDLEQFVYRQELLGLGLKSRVSEAELQSSFDAKLKAAPDDFVWASVRHILIGLTDNATGEPRTKEEALKRANDVLSKLKAGGDFAKLAGEYSDDPGSSANGGLYEDAPVGNWVVPFKEAAKSLPLNQLSEPVETEYGYHLMKVESRRTITLQDVRDELLSEASQQQFQRFLTEELPGIIQSMELPK